MNDFIACLGCNQTLGIGASEYCPRCRLRILPLRENPNEWPAYERGDILTHEGWEEMDRWFNASRIEPEGTHAGKSVKDQLDWLAEIRAKNDLLSEKELSLEKA